MVAFDPLATDDVVTVVNSLFWGNSRSGTVDEPAQLRIGNGELHIDYTCLEGWTGDYGGTANNGVPIRSSSTSSVPTVSPARAMRTTT